MSNAEYTRPARSAAELLSRARNEAVIALHDADHAEIEARFALDAARAAGARAEPLEDAHAAARRVRIKAEAELDAAIAALIAAR